MLNINFVPDDYMQSSESRRTNLLYLVLFGIVMATLGGSFLAIKLRQHVLSREVRCIDAETAREEEDLKKLGELQAKRGAMMRTALTTAELLEPVPRSVLLASLTNTLPPGVSLLRVSLIQKEPKYVSRVAGSANKYRQAQAKKATAAQAKVSGEKLLETHIDIGGMAPSDLQVAAYIERLSSSNLLDNVALVESKEYKIEDVAFRQFKLTAMLRKDVHLSNEDIEKIRAGGKNAAWNF